MNRETRLSVIVNSVDARRCAALRSNLERTLGDFEFVHVPDARSMAEGLNRGAAQAHGEWLLFCHDDIAILNDDARPIVAQAFHQCDMFGACGTTRLVSGNWYDAGVPYTKGQVVARDLNTGNSFDLQLFGLSDESLCTGIAALDGILIACRRSLFDALRGFNETDCTGWVLYDIDLSFRAHLARARVGVACDLLVFHDSHPGEFPPEKLLDWDASQRRFERSFARYLTAEPGERRHESIPVGQVAEAWDALQERRRHVRPRSAARRWWTTLRGPR